VPLFSWFDHFPDSRAGTCQTFSLFFLENLRHLKDILKLTGPLVTFLISMEKILTCFKRKQEKFRRFVDSEFVKKCHEHVIQHHTHNKRSVLLFVERYKAETIYFYPAFWRTVIPRCNGNFCPSPAKDFLVVPCCAVSG